MLALVGNQAVKYVTPYELATSVTLTGQALCTLRKRRKQALLLGQEVDQ